MSLATRCTHCGTIFKVVEDQLKVSDGWVRCGRCQQVFNAMPTLFDMATEAPPPRPSATPPTAAPIPAPTPESSAPPVSPYTRASADRPAPLTEDDLSMDSQPPVQGTTDFELDTAVTVEMAPQAPPPRAYAPPALPEELPSTDESDALDSRYLVRALPERKPARRRDSGPEFADAEFPSDAMFDAESDWSPPAEPPVDAPQSAPHSAPDSAPQPAAAPEAPQVPPSQREGQPGTRGRAIKPKTPDFIRRAHRQAFWRQPGIRGLLSGLALALLLTLGLQVMHQFRDLLAAYHPELRPWLSQWCVHAQCEIKPPLRLDDLQVESATLLRASSEGPDRYRLAVVIKNRAPIDLAWPHVDLSLNNEQGAVIARRSFSPTEAQWLDSADPKTGTPTRTPAAAPRQRSTTLVWNLRATDLQPAGYTAELFYP